MSLLYFIWVYRMRCRYMLGQCCPNATSNASIEWLIYRPTCRYIGLFADALKHDVFIDQNYVCELYDCVWLCITDIFCLNRYVSALWGNTVMFRLSRSTSFKNGDLACSGASVTTPEVTRGTRIVSPLIIAFCDLEDGGRRLRNRCECL